MSLFECTRKINFCSGHRIVGHEKKCANAHGHNYTLFITARSNQLDSIGRVIDFSDLKKMMEGWIDQNWDHTFIIFEKDELLMPLKDKLTINKKVFVSPFNPTAENMANYLLTEVCPDIFKEKGIVVTKVEIWESDKNKVTVSL